MSETDKWTRVPEDFETEENIRVKFPDGWENGAYSDSSTNRGVQLPAGTEGTATEGVWNDGRFPVEIKLDTPYVEKAGHTTTEVNALGNTFLIPQSDLDRIRGEANDKS